MVGSAKAVVASTSIPPVIAANLSFISSLLSRIGSNRWDRRHLRRHARNLADASRKVYLKFSMPPQNSQAGFLLMSTQQQVQLLQHVYGPRYPFCSCRNPDR